MASKFSLVCVIVFLRAVVISGSVLSHEDRFLAGLITSEGLMETISPLSQKIGDSSRGNLVEVLNDFVSLHELMQITDSLASESVNIYLKGLSALINEVVNDGCAWIKEAVDEDFQCTDSGINGLKVKLNAYGSFKNTAMGLKKYKSGTTKCSVAS